MACNTPGARTFVGSHGRLGTSINAKHTHIVARRSVSEFYGCEVIKAIRSFLSIVAMTVPTPKIKNRLIIHIVSTKPSYLATWTSGNTATYAFLFDAKVTLWED
jgi:hypothetical protein